MTFRETHSCDNNFLYEELTGKGCTDVAQAAVGTVVYQNLSKIKNWVDVSLEYNGELQQVYLSGKPEKSSDTRIVIPIDCKRELTFADMLRLQSVSTISKNITLALCDQDSTVVYYELSDGINAPRCPETDAPCSSPGGNKMLQ